MTKYRLKLKDRVLKRSFDVVFSFLGLIVLSPLILLTYVIAFIDTQESGFFVQKRMGRFGKKFNVIKIRTMKTSENNNRHVTTSNDLRISKSGRIFRKYKLDELPQLINVLKGEMSFVGPRPDIPGMYDDLTINEKVILNIRPGITGPASIKYKNEEELLAVQENPIRYNKEVIFTDKIRINKKYIEKYSFFKDIQYIFKTLFS